MTARHSVTTTAEEVEETAPARGGRRAALWTAGLLGAVALFVLYLHQSRTQAVDADGASNVLQAWDMVHGNLLLRGWSLSDVSFYTTELPQYMLIVALRGLHPDVVHIGGAMTYVLLVVLAGWLARGRLTGRVAVVAALTPLGIMLAPQLGVGTYVLLLNPAHLGTGVAVLVTWLVLDKARQRWYVPVVIGVLLTWGQIADALVTAVAAAPLVVVSLVRLLRTTRSRYDAGLLAAGVLSVPAADLALRLIHAIGGFSVARPGTPLATWQAITSDVRSPVEDVLLLFGADVYRTPPQADIFGQPNNPHSAVDVTLALVHLLGLALVALALVWTAARFFRRAERVEQLLLVGIVIDLGAFIVRARPDQNLTNSREIVLLLPLGAVLAGRILAAWLQRRGSPATALALLAVIFAVYAAGLLHNLSGTPVPAQGQGLADWLLRHHLRYGVAGHWAANNVTVDSGGRVHVVSVSPVTGNAIVPRPWESKDTWYDPTSHRATFAVVDNLNLSYLAYLTEPQVEAAFGKPAEIHHVGAYTVLVWHKNLLQP